MISMNEILAGAVERGASDILIVAGLPVAYKINGQIIREGERLLPKDTSALTEELYDIAVQAEKRTKDEKSLSRISIDQLHKTGDDDFSFSVPGLSRFRVNALRQRGSLGVVIRVVSFQLPDRKALHIPDAIMDFATYSKGLVLITGAAGSGKSTTLACIIDAINNSRSAHIITIEDPIEYLHQHKKSVVVQRELYSDTATYDVALRAALREAPDIILVGEMRDAETIKATVTAAETGHLVISTLHTIGAANTIDRIIDSFPSEQQQQIRTQLALVLEGVVSQQLIPAVDGELVPAFEIMKVNSAARNLIRESKAHQLDNLISTSAAQGMVTMDQSLLKLLQQGKITKQQALDRSVNYDWMSKRLNLVK